MQIISCEKCPSIFYCVSPLRGGCRAQGLNRLYLTDIAFCSGLRSRRIPETVFSRRSDLDSFFIGSQIRVNFTRIRNHILKNIQFLFDCLCILVCCEIKESILPHYYCKIKQIRTMKNITNQKNPSVFFILIHYNALGYKIRISIFLSFF